LLRLKQQGSSLSFLITELNFAVAPTGAGSTAKRDGRRSDRLSFVLFA
jgi:hypothetical protein